MTMPAVPAAPPAPEPAPVPPVPVPPADPPTPTEPPVATETPEEQIARLQNEVKSARAEAGKERINAKANAAEEARKELAQQVGKALGLVDDGATDPAKLLEQATSAQAAAKQSAIKLAIYQSADVANGDPTALLDSVTFLASVAEIEPSDTVALAAAITAAVAENPRLGKAAPATPPAPGSGMKPNPAQGSSASQPLGVDAQIAAATAAGNFKEAIRLKTAQSLTTT